MKAPDEAIQREIVLFRAVSVAEAVDIQAHGLRVGPNSLLGKWFATDHADARRWGVLLALMESSTNPPPFRVVSVRFPTDAGIALVPFSSVDGIGPAFFVAVEYFDELNQVAEVEISPEVYYP